MAGLNLITGTGRQTVEEIKQDLFTAQSDIEHLDSDYVELEGRVSNLETGTKELKVVKNVSTTISKIQFGPQSTDEIVSMIESGMYKLSNATTADYLVGGSTSFQPVDSNGDKGGYSDLRLVIPEGTKNFNVRYESGDGYYQTTVFVYNPDVNGEVIKSVVCRYPVQQSGLYNNVSQYNQGKVNIKGNFPLTINLSSVVPEDTTVSTVENQSGIRGDYLNA